MLVTPTLGLNVELETTRTGISLKIVLLHQTNIQAKYQPVKNSRLENEGYNHFFFYIMPTNSDRQIWVQWSPVTPHTTRMCSQTHTFCIRKDYLIVECPPGEIEVSYSCSVFITRVHKILNIYKYSEVINQLWCHAKTWLVLHVFNC